MENHTGKKRNLQISIYKKYNNDVILNLKNRKKSEGFIFVL
jgi:hypothetical protein